MQSDRQARNEYTGACDRYRKDPHRTPIKSPMQLPFRIQDEDSWGQCAHSALAKASLPDSATPVSNLRSAKSIRAESRQSVHPKTPT